MLRYCGAPCTLRAAGNLPIGFVLTLYAVPFSYAGVILVAFVGSGIALALARSMAWLPTRSEHHEPVTTPEGTPS